MADRLAKAFGLIVDSMADEGARPELAAEIARLCGSFSFYMHVFGLNASRFIAAHNLNADVAADYEAHFWRRDVWAQSCMEKGARVIAGEAIIRNEDFVRTEFYNDFLRPTGDLFRCAGAVTALDVGERVAIGVHRTRTQPQFEDEAVAALEALRPSLQRLVQAILRSERRDLSLAEQILEADTDAVMVADRGCRLLYANRAAVDPAARTPITLRENRVTPHAEVDLLRFATAVERACGGRGGSTLQLGDGTGAPHAVAVDPLPGAPGVAVLRWRDEDARLHEDLRAATSALGLTTAEAAMAEAMLRGKSPADHAAQRGVSITTVRSQLRSLFEKAGVSRQAELVAALKAGRLRTRS